MANLARYTCHRDLVPCIEAALAANGYVVTETVQRENDGTVLVVLCSGTAQVLLATCPDNDAADIEVWGDAQAAAVQLLEGLPFDLLRHACICRS
jgi:hypothetical protein